MPAVGAQTGSAWGNVDTSGPITGFDEYRYIDLGESNFRDVGVNSIDESVKTFDPDIDRTLFIPQLEGG